MAKLTARAVESTFKDKEGNTVYRMIVSANGKVDTAEIAQSTADDTRMAAPLVKAISEAFSGQMVAALANGYRIDTDYFTIGFRVLGRFNGPEDDFDPKRHSLELSFQMKSKAKKMLSDLEVVNGHRGRHQLDPDGRRFRRRFEHAHSVESSEYGEVGVD